MADKDTDLLKKILDALNRSQLGASNNRTRYTSGEGPTGEGRDSTATDRFNYHLETSSTRMALFNQAINKTIGRQYSLAKSIQDMEKQMKYELVNKSAEFKRAARASYDLVRTNQITVQKLNDGNKAIAEFSTKMGNVTDKITSVDVKLKKKDDILSELKGEKKALKKLRDSFSISGPTTKQKNKEKELLESIKTKKKSRDEATTEITTAHNKLVAAETEFFDAYTALTATGVSLDVYFKDLSPAVLAAINANNLATLSSEQLSEAFKVLDSATSGANRTLHVLTNQLESSERDLADAYKSFVSGLWNMAKAMSVAAWTITRSDSLSRTKANLTDYDSGSLMKMGLSVSDYATFVDDNRVELRASGMGDENRMMNSGELSSAADYARNLGFSGPEALKVISDSMRVMRNSGIVYNKDNLKFQMDSMKALQTASGMSSTQVADLYNSLGNSGVLSEMGMKYDDKTEAAKQKAINNEIQQRAKLNTLLGKTNDNLNEQLQKESQARNGPLMDKVRQQIMGQVAFAQVNELLPEGDKIDTKYAQFVSAIGRANIKNIVGPNAEEEKAKAWAAVEKFDSTAQGLVLSNNNIAANNPNGYLAADGRQYAIDFATQEAGVRDEQYATMQHAEKRAADNRKGPLTKFTELLTLVTNGGKNDTITTRGGSIDEIAANGNLTVTIDNLSGILGHFGGAISRVTTIFEGIAKNPYLSGLAATAGGMLGTANDSIWTLLGAHSAWNLLRGARPPVPPVPPGGPPGPGGGGWRGMLTGKVGKAALITGAVVGAVGLYKYLFDDDNNQTQPEQQIPNGPMGQNVSQLMVNELVVKNLTAVNMLGNFLGTDGRKIAQSGSSDPATYISEKIAEAAGISTVSNKEQEILAKFDRAPIGEPIQAGMDIGTIGGLIGTAMLASTGWGVLQSARTAAAAAGGAGLAAGAGGAVAGLARQIPLMMAFSSASQTAATLTSEKGVDTYYERFGMKRDNNDVDMNPLLSVGFWKEASVAWLGAATDLADKMTLGAVGDLTWREKGELSNITEQDLEDISDLPWGRTAAETIREKQAAAYVDNPNGGKDPIIVVLESIAKVVTDFYTFGKQQTAKQEAVENAKNTLGGAAKMKADVEKNARERVALNS